MRPTSTAEHAELMSQLPSEVGAERKAKTIA